MAQVEEVCDLLAMYCTCWLLVLSQEANNFGCGSKLPMAFPATWHHRVYTPLMPLMPFSSLTRAADCTVTACSLQTQAGALAGQAAQSAVQRSPPFVTHIMGYYSFNQTRKDGRLSWPCWLTDIGRHTHKVVKQPSISLAQDWESPPSRIDVLTTILRHQTGRRQSWSSSSRFIKFKFKSIETWTNSLPEFPTQW